MKGAKVLQVRQPADGGISHQAGILAQEMKDRDLPVGIACSPGALSERMRGSSIEVHELPLVRQVSPWKDLSAAYALWRIIRKGGYSLIHGHSTKAGAGLPVVAADVEACGT